MSHYHAVVWMDHEQARIFEFNADAAESRVIHAPTGEGHIHHKAGVIGAGHSHGSSEFFTEVGGALATAEAVLVMGPGVAKQEFAHHVSLHDKALEAKIADVETVDHLTDHQIVARARDYFAIADRMQPQRG